MPLYREHRGGLIESMATVVEINDLNELIEHIRKTNPFYKPESIIDIVEYGGFDSRINWYTYAVRADQQIVGFTNDPLTPKEIIPCNNLRNTI